MYAELTGDDFTFFNEKGKSGQRLQKIYYFRYLASTFGSKRFKFDQPTELAHVIYNDLTNAKKTRADFRRPGQSRRVVVSASG